MGCLICSSNIYIYIYLWIYELIATGLAIEPILIKCLRREGTACFSEWQVRPLNGGQVGDEGCTWGSDLDPQHRIALCNPRTGKKGEPWRSLAVEASSSKEFQVQQENYHKKHGGEQRMETTSAVDPWPLHIHIHMWHMPTQTHTYNNTHCYWNSFPEGAVASTRPPKVLTTEARFYQSSFWGPREFIGCISQGFSRVLGLTDWAGGWPTNPGNLPISACRVLGLQMCAATYWTQVLLLTKWSLYQLNYIPRPVIFFITIQAIAI